MAGTPTESPCDRNDAAGRSSKPLQACQLITRYGVVNSLVGCVKPLISTTGQPADHASHDQPAAQPDETTPHAAASAPARPMAGRPS